MTSFYIFMLLFNGLYYYKNQKSSGLLVDQINGPPTLFQGSEQVEKQTWEQSMAALSVLTMIQWEGVAQCQSPWTCELNPMIKHIYSLEWEASLSTPKMGRNNWTWEDLRQTCQLILPIFTNHSTSEMECRNVQREDRRVCWVNHSSRKPGEREKLPFKLRVQA